MGSQKDLEEYVGRRLREKRQKLGMTLAYVAEKLSISHQQIQKYEQAQSRISAAILFQIGQVYGVPSHYFFEGYRSDIEKKPEIPAPTDVITYREEKNLNILLVEDNPADELLTRRALEASKHKINVFCVHDGVQAIEFLRYKTLAADFPRPDVVLLDLNIPKRDGHTVLKEIKRDRDIQDIPVVILTNSISIQEMVSIYKNYASGYISKSFDYDVFEDSLIGFVNYWVSVVVLPNTAQEQPCLDF